MNAAVIKVITGNAGKAQELASILNCTVECHKLDLPEIQSLNVAEVALKKAEAAYALTGEPVIVDDTGMSIEALEGFPGALVSWMLDTTGIEGLLKLMDGQTNRAATVSTAIGYADENGVQVFLGELSGTIPSGVRGEGGFGYDPIFIPQGHSKTFAEMSAAEKDAISMRKLAVEKLRDFWALNR